MAATGKLRPRTSRTTARSTKAAYRGSVWSWTLTSEPGAEIQAVGKPGHRELLAQQRFRSGEVVAGNGEVEVEAHDWLDVGVDRLSTDHAISHSRP